MMLIATRLGIIACGYLVSGYYDNRYISAPEIAERYNMNVRALMPALRQLTKSGILRSRVGGKEPGFIYAKDPKEYTLYQIIITLEGDARFCCTKELVPKLKCDCEDKSECQIFSLFNWVIATATDKLSSISIAEYADKQKSI